MNISAAQSQYDPDWIAYGWEWKLNGQIYSFTEEMDGQGVFLPDGFSEICLTVFGTDTITNDSCAVQICNIFQSTGHQLFAQFHAIPDGGNTYTIGGYYYGGDPQVIEDLTIYFGDGTIVTQSISAQHTYASPGDYLVCFLVTDPITSAFSQSCREIHVNNSLPELDVNGLPHTSGCAPITINGILSNPGYPDSDYYLVGNDAPGGTGTVVSGFSFDVPPNGVNVITPGQVMMKAEVQDASPNSGFIDRYAPLFFDVCGVVPDTVSGYVFSDSDADGIFDVTESGLAGKEVKLYSAYDNSTNYSAITDSTGYYELLAPPAIFKLKVASPGGSVTIPGANTYTVNGAGGSSFSGMNFGIANLTTTISGRVYLDVNHDSTRNVPPDINYYNGTVRAKNVINGNTYYENTTSNGTYTFNISDGDYVIEPVYFLLDSAEVYPDSVSINSNGGTFNNNDFGLYSGVAGNFGVFISSNSEPRPGFYYLNVIEVTNTGFDTIAGDLVYSFDTTLTMTAVVPSGGVIDNVNHTVTWNAVSVLPASRVFFSTGCTIPASVPIGSLLGFSAYITPLPGYIDSQPGNNFDTASVMVIGSYDPNDKAVFPSGQGASGAIIPDQRLHYRIRFQNTGTASAINVIVQDEIDLNLDMNSFEMVDASHSYNLIINDHSVTWKFINIMLPDSTTDEPGSHGYIDFAISPVDSLPDGTILENTADIYFDFNAPVITNTTVNTIQSTSQIESLVSENGLLVYPNPADKSISIYSAGLKNFNCSIYNTTGSLIYSGRSEGAGSMLIETENFREGLYFFQVTDVSGKQVMTGKFLVGH